MTIHAAGIAAILLSVPVGGFAATVYSTGPLNFETTERQSVWGTGAASRLDGTHFFGANWNEQFSTGGIVGNVSTSRIPTPTYVAARAAWDSCKALAGWLVDCGSAPDPDHFTVTTDTRTGAQADVTTNGRVGFEVNYLLDAGSVGAEVEYDATASLPAQIVAGEKFTLQTGSAFTNGTLDVQSPTAQASVDAILEAYAHADAKGCILLAGCVEGSGVIFDIDEDRELIGIDPNQITFLDGFTPGGVELSTPLASRTFTLALDLTTLTPEIEDEDAPVDDVDVSIELAQVKTNVPIINESGGKVGDRLEVNGRADFLDITVDLDTLFSATGILPPGGVSLGFGPVGVSADTYDFDAGPSLDMFQDVSLKPRLMVDLLFSKPVEIAGQLVDSFTGAWDALPEMAVFEKTVFKPVFYTVADFLSSTGLQAGLELSMEFLKASIGLSAFGVDLLDLSLGPLVDETFAYDPEWAKFSIFDANYEMEAFNRITGPSFVLAPGRSGIGLGIPAVPIPSTLPFLAAGIGALVLARRRRT